MKIIQFVLAISVLTFGGIVSAEKLEKSSVDRYNVKGIKIGMSEAEVKKFIPNFELFPCDPRYFVCELGDMHFKFEVEKGLSHEYEGTYLKTYYEGRFYSDNLLSIRIKDQYNKIDIDKIKDKLDAKYGKRVFIKSTRKGDRKYTVESNLETLNLISAVNNLPAVLHIVKIYDDNENFVFKQEATSRELGATIKSVLDSKTLKKKIKHQDRKKKLAKEKSLLEEQRDKFKNMQPEEVEL